MQSSKKLPICRYYSREFAEKVVHAYLREHVREQTFLSQIYRFPTKYLIEMFRFNQKKWNFYKRLMKIVSSLMKMDYSLTHVKHLIDKDIELFKKTIDQHPDPLDAVKFWIYS